RGRRRPGSHLPPGGHRGRQRLYGCARRRAVPRRRGGPPRNGPHRPTRGGVSTQAANPPGMAATWLDLLDPTPEELRAKAPKELEDTALEQLLAPPQHEDEPRPTLQGHGDYVFGVFLIAVAVPEDDEIYYQE